MATKASSTFGVPIAVFPPNVSSPEKLAGIETAIRSFAPKDVADMAGTFGGGGGGGGGGNDTVYTGATPLTGTITTGVVVKGGNLTITGPCTIEGSVKVYGGGVITDSDAGEITIKGDLWVEEAVDGTIGSGVITVEGSVWVGGKTTIVDTADTVMFSWFGGQTYVYASSLNAPSGSYPYITVSSSSQSTFGGTGSTVNGMDLGMVETASPLTSTFVDNGGVGDTLTSVTVEQAIKTALGGYAWVDLQIGHKILVKNQTSGAEDGIYTVTNAGSDPIPEVPTNYGLAGPSDSTGYWARDDVAGDTKGWLMEIRSGSPPPPGVNVYKYKFWLSPGGLGNAPTNDGYTTIRQVTYPLNSTAETILNALRTAMSEFPSAFTTTVPTYNPSGAYWGGTGYWHMELKVYSLATDAGYRMVGAAGVFNYNWGGGYGTNYEPFYANSVNWGSLAQTGWQWVLTREVSGAISSLSGQWLGQLMTTPSIAPTLSGVSIWTNSGPNITSELLKCDVYATSGGFPTGSSLASATYPLNPSSGYNSIPFTFSTPLALAASTTYALVFSYASGALAGGVTLPAQAAISNGGAIYGYATGGGGVQWVGDVWAIGQQFSVTLNWATPLQRQFTVSNYSWGSFTLDASYGDVSSIFSGGTPFTYPSSSLLGLKLVPTAQLTQFVCKGSLFTKFGIEGAGGDWDGLSIDVHEDLIASAQFSGTNAYPENIGVINVSGGLTQGENWSGGQSTRAGKGGVVRIGGDLIGCGKFLSKGSTGLNGSDINGGIGGTLLVLGTYTGLLQIGSITPINDWAQLTGYIDVSGGGGFTGDAGAAGSNGGNVFIVGDANAGFIANGGYGHTTVGRGGTVYVGGDLHVSQVYSDPLLGNTRQISLLGGSSDNGQGGDGGSLFVVGKIAYPYLSRSSFSGGYPNGQGVLNGGSTTDLVGYICANGGRGATIGGKGGNIAVMGGVYSIPSISVDGGSAADGTYAQRGGAGGIISIANAFSPLNNSNMGSSGYYHMLLARGGQSYKTEGGQGGLIDLRNIGYIEIPHGRFDVSGGNQTGAGGITGAGGTIWITANGYIFADMFASPGDCSPGSTQSGRIGMITAIGTLQLGSITSRLSSNRSGYASGSGIRGFTFGGNITVYQTYIDSAATDARICPYNDDNYPVGKTSPMFRHTSGTSLGITTLTNAGGGGTPLAFNASGAVAYAWTPTGGWRSFTST